MVNRETIDAARTSLRMSPVLNLRTVVPYVSTKVVKR